MDFERTRAALRALQHVLVFVPMHGSIGDQSSENILDNWISCLGHRLPVKGCMTHPPRNPRRPVKLKQQGVRICKCVFIVLDIVTATPCKHRKKRVSCSTPTIVMIMGLE